MFEDKSFSEAETMLKALKAAREWQSAIKPQVKITNSASPKDCPPVNTPPAIPGNTTGLFSDAAWNSTTLAGGLGWVAKKQDGSVLFQGTDARRIVCSALVAEAMALKTALSVAVSVGLKDLICFSDSKCLVDLLT